MTDLPELDLTLGGKIAAPSFQSLFIRMKYGETHLASGTGFLVHGHTGIGLVTARHNLTGRDHESGDCLHSQGGIPDRIEIFHNAPAPVPNELRTERIIGTGGEALWLEHPRLGSLCDVALLPLHDLAGIAIAPYGRQQIYPDIAVKVTEPVSVVGFPMGQSAGAMYAIWCTGYIASEPSQDYAGQPKFLVDCRTRKGQSGSPVIAYRNDSFKSQGGGMTFGVGQFFRPLGVYTGRIHAKADIGVVWKWSVVEDLIMQLDLYISRELQRAMMKFGRESVEFAAILEKYSLTILPDGNDPSPFVGVSVPEKGLPDGYVAHEGGPCPLDADAYVDLIIRTSEGLGHSGACRAKFHDWLWANQPDGMGSVLGYKFVDREAKFDVHVRWPE